jgi:hypothetical protein
MRRSRGDTAIGCRLFPGRKACAKRFFRCPTLRATLSPEGCASNWRRAQRVSADELGFSGKCRDCPIGALHAGESHVHRSRLFGAQIRPRTRCWASRLIGNRLGIGAYNREREVKIGRNAKNTRPQLVLEPRRLGVILKYGSPDRRLVDPRDELTAVTIELAVQTLRVATGRIAFRRPRGGPAISTADLARQMAPERSPSRGLIAHAVAKPRLGTARHAAPVDRLPNEFRDESQSDVSPRGGALARDLGMKKWHERQGDCARTCVPRCFKLASQSRPRRAGHLAPSSGRPGGRAGVRLRHDRGARPR